MRNIAGISQSSSQRAVDMLMKCQYLQELYNGRGVTFATETPKQTSIERRRFNVYDETKQQLIQMGIPEAEIAFVRDAKTDTQRDEMFDKVCKGEIRILLGSTSKLGTGTNIQTKLITLHHLDVPWV